MNNPEKMAKRGDHDSLERRCPMLGHGVRFSYCRTTGTDTLCRKIFDCWWETFDVVSFVTSCYPQEEVRAALSPGKEKTLSLVELIQRARKMKSGNS